MTAFPRRRRSRPLSDADAARLLHGTPAEDRPDLAGAATFAAALRSTSQEPPAPSAALATLLAQGFDPATVTPAVDAPAGSRRRTLGYGLIRLAGASLAVKVATGGGVALAAVATAGTAGVLPDPVQDRVDSVLEAVTPFDRGAGNPQAPERPTVTPSPAATPSGGPDTRPTELPTGRPTDLPSPARPAGPPSTRPAPPVPPKASPASQRPTENPAQSRASARPSPAAERPAPQASRRPTEPPRAPAAQPTRQAPAPAQDAPAPPVPRLDTPRPDTAHPDTATPAERPTR